MPREVISTPEAPEYPSYSQAVKVGQHDPRNVL
jgi:2-iminobutanoate/2-iminopropanoate deaminase